ncbi:hypothetical protein [Rufibacter latericius]|uniref:Uncharacterized protein n=1 Tax=Rufibacter latericius TaxID=2487040 RepID=A0A3M9MB15_9BACT|nr:hypothetical protein [Rufibacter latericius]RNI22043.1 hypothetical protein EFB08_23205 [Rufibacter latericius]
MNIADIKTEFGAYYLNNGQNLSRLFKLLNYKSATDSILTPILTDETVWRAAQATIGRVLQLFQKAWTPLNRLEFKPPEIQMFKLKVDKEEYPDDLESSWFGFLTGEGIDCRSGLSSVGSSK